MARNGGGMWGLFLESAIKLTNIFGAFKLFRSRDGSPVIDNAVFQLHYRTTTLSLLASSLFLSIYQYIGNPIDCYGQPNSSLRKLDHVIDNYCWMRGVYVHFNLSVSTLMSEQNKTVNLPENPNFTRFYQYVCFVLFLQASCFYATHYIWKMLEDNRLQSLVQSLGSNSGDNYTNKAADVRVLENYYRRNLHSHRSYALKFYACEVINLLQTIFQVILTDGLVNFQLSSYGLLGALVFLAKNQEERRDALAEIFPRMTKCRVFFYDDDQRVTSQNFICILPLNVAVERIYVFAWLWFLVLAVLSACQLIHDALACLKKGFRNALLKSRCRLTSSERLDTVLEKAHLGDWFVLLQLAKNVDPVTFRKFIDALCNYGFYDVRSGDAASVVRIV